MIRLALATAIAAAGLDEDLPPLLEACANAGLQVQVRAWDDPTVSWSRFDAVVLRSTWDYATRLPEFLHWCEATAASTRLVNALPVVRWNLDKHYLADLAARGVPIVPSAFVEPDADPLSALQAFLASHASAQFVVKPAVGAGSRDAQRYTRSQEFAAANHVGRLLEAGRSVLLQPYLAAVDTQGETALMMFAGRFSHAIRKGPLLPLDGPGVDHLFAAESISAREPDADEQRLAHATLDALQQHLLLDTPPPYARVDLIRDDAGQPCLLELELCEPSLFFAQAPGSPARFVDALVAHLAQG